MAHHSATKKAIRQTVKRNERNTYRRTRLRNSVKNCQTAVEGNNVEDAQKYLKQAQKDIDKATSHNVIKANTASRMLSRLNKSVKAIAKTA